MFRADNQADASILETLKVGDTALVQSQSGWHGSGKQVINEREVVKVTPTQIHVKLRADGYAVKYDRRTGFSIGDGKRSAIVDPTHPTTAKAMESTRTMQARNKLDAAIEAYRRNNFDAGAVRGVLTAATHLAGRLDMML